MKNIGTVKTNKKSFFTIGTDFEAMLYDVDKKDIVSSIPVLKRDKHTPILLDKNDGIFCYADNVNIEFSSRPASSKKDFVNILRNCFQKGQRKLGKKYRLIMKSAHYFKKDDLKPSHGIDPNEIGCSPSFCAYKQEVKKLNVEDAFNKGMRSGFGHIHLGMGDTLKDFDMRHKALRVVEIIVGSSSVLWDNDETSKIRRMCYGQSGEIRCPEHGLEARFMGNYVFNSPKLVELTYDLVEYCLSKINNNTYQEIIDSVNENDVQSAINNCDKKLSREILIKAKLPKDLFDRVIEESKKSYKMVDLYKNWDIKV